jgi:hypothetical protein
VSSDIETKLDRIPPPLGIKIDGSPHNAIMSASLPKPHLPGKGVAYPLRGEGGRPFEPGQVRETHFSAGDVGVSTLVGQTLKRNSTTSPSCMT